MYENTIRIARKPCRAEKLRETSMLLHLPIISAESDKITESKLKLLYVRQAS